MKRTVLILLVAVFLMTIGQVKQAHAQWMQLDVGSPWEVWSVAVIGSTVFAGTFAGTYRSTDGGQSWTNVNGAFTECFVQKGSDILAGSYYGVLKSTDDGMTWTNPDSSLNANILHMVVKDSVIYAGGSGLFRSTDDGATWTAIENGLVLGPVNGLALVGTNVFAATGAGVIESTNGGNSWSTVTGTGSVNDFTSCIAAYDSTILVGWNGGIIRSTDGGNTWNWPSTQYPMYSGTVMSIVMDSAYSYIGTNNGVMLSTDRGVTWHSASNGLPDNIVLSIAVADTNLYATSFDNGVYASTDNGANWTYAANGIVGSDITSISGEGSNVYAVFRYDSIFSSTDNGNTWVADTGLTGTGHIWGVTVIGTEVYVPTEGGIFTSSDSGKTWSHFYGWARAIVKSGTNLVLASSRVYFSTNGGESWLLANDSPSNSGPSGIFCLATTGTDVFAAGDGGIYRSTDNGEDWDDVDSNLVNITSLAASGSTVVAGRYIPPVPLTDSILPPPGGLFLSTDNGQTWSPYVNGLPGYGYPQVWAVAVRGMDVFTGLTTQGAAVFYPSTFYSSTINRDNWLNTGQSLPILGISSIYINDSSIFVGISQEGGIWRAPLSQVTGIDQPGVPVVPTVIKLKQNYPNPFNPTTAISYQLSAVNNVTLRIYDVLGREVKTLVNNERQTPGTYTVIWNGTNEEGEHLSSGMYFYRLITEHGILTKKAVYLK